MKTYQMIWRLVRYRPGLYLFNGALWTMVHTFPLFPGLIAKAYFDMLGEGRTDDALLWWLVAAVVAVALGRVVNILGGAIVDTIHRFTMSSLLRRNLLDGILAMPGARPLLDSPSEAITRFREDVIQVEHVISWTLDLIGSATFAGVAMVVLFQISPRVTLMVFLPMIGVVSIARILGDRLERYRKEAREATGRVTDAIGETFSSVQSIKVAGAEEPVVQHLRRLNDERRRAMLRDRGLSEVLNSVFSNTASIGTGFIILLVAGPMSQGSFSVGDFALFVYYLQFVADFTVFFGHMLALYRQTAVSLRRLRDLLPGSPAAALVAHNPLYFGEIPASLALEVGARPGGREPSPLPSPSPQPPPLPQPLERLDVVDLSYRHPDNSPGIDGVSFSLWRGTLTVITGQVGAGKTTLLRVLLGLLPSSGGSVLWNGVEVTDPASFMVPPQCAYTPQVPRLFSDTVRNNIAMGLAVGDEELAAALEGAVFEEDLAGMEQGLETVVGPKGVKLSGGQAQRVAAARMFARQSQLLVFDDLSSALDVETERRLWERIIARPGATCLAVSHRRTAFKLADWIIVLKDGRIHQQGTMEELQEQSEEFRRLLLGLPEGRAEQRKRRT